MKYFPRNQSIHLSFSLSFDLSEDQPDTPLRIELDYTPPRPPPPCSNPSSPLYSDPGDPAEIEDLRVFQEETNEELYTFGTHLIPSSLLDRIYDKAYEEYLKEGRF